VDYLPIFLNLRDRTALIVGGGDVACAKARLVAEAGARIRVVAPVCSQAMEEAIALRGWDYLPERFEARHLDGAALVIAATDDSDVNVSVHRTGTDRGLPVNVADNPTLCSFILPAIVDRAPVTIAISTGGTSPVFARWVRTLLESTLPAGLAALGDLLARFRTRLKQRFPDPDERRRFVEQQLQGPVRELALAGQGERAEALLEQALETPDGRVGVSSPGEVYLLGAGPGDPDLLTFRALRLLQQAEIVLYDRLVPEAVLRLCRREARLHYVGKRKGDHAVGQAELSELLVRYARQGFRVARLKGGDPFVFGRGGEEIERLVDERIPFVVVPGISAANGCGAYAGIPLTHRDHAQGVSFWTAHHRADGGLELDWQRLSMASNETLVFYMGLGSLARICAGLVRHGRSAATPAALVEQGTTPRQRVFAATLATLPGEVSRAAVQSPALLIVGSVVSLHHRLSWFKAPGTEAPVFPQHRSRPNS
jgi:uroporphyrin-III C-methyltransferase/precorrin-2 dehydrogenase/sirohydrochlorin ferrochelatase